MSCCVVRADTVVIGSGISGLTLAALLAKHGRRVVVCERHPCLGGSIKRFRRKGMSFDTGFHYSGSLGSDESIRRLWDYIGIADNIHVIPFPEDGHDLLVIGRKRRRVRAFFSYDRFCEELHSIFPREKSAIKAYFDMVKELCSHVPFYNPSLPPDSFHRDFFRYANIGFARYISGLTSDAYLHAALSAPSFLYGVLPERATLAAHARVANCFYTGVCGIRGGGQSISDALIKQIRDNGGELISGFDVNSILERDGCAAGVVSSDGIVINAPEVVFSGNPRLLPAILSSGTLRPAFFHRLSALSSTMSMFVLFGTMSVKDMEPLRWNNIWRMPAGFRLLSPSDDSRECMVMISAPSVKESDNVVHEQEREIIIMSPAWWEDASRFYAGRRKRKAGYREWKKKHIDRLLYTAEKFFEGCIKIVESASPCTFVDELASPEGGAYGVQHCIGQYNPGPVTRLRGMFLTGQAIVMPGIVGASLSAIVTAGKMPGMENIWSRISECPHTDHTT